MPSFATINYLKQNELMFKVSIFFVPTFNNKINMVVGVFIPKSNIILRNIKFFILKQFLNLAFKQDKYIIESQDTNNTNYKIIDIDLVIEMLLYLYEMKHQKPILKNNFKLII